MWRDSNIFNLNPKKTECNFYVHQWVLINTIRVRNGRQDCKYDHFRVLGSGPKTTNNSIVGFGLWHTVVWGGQQSIGSLEHIYSNNGCSLAMISQQSWPALSKVIHTAWAPRCTAGEPWRRPQSVANLCILDCLCFIHFENYYKA